MANTPSRKEGHSRYALLMSSILCGAGALSFNHVANEGSLVPRVQPGRLAKAELPNMIGKRIDLSRLQIPPEDRGILLLVMPGCGSCQLNPFDVVPAWFIGKPNVFAVFPDDIRQVSNTYKSSIPRDRVVVDPEFSVLPSSLFYFAPLVLKLDHLGTVIAISKETESPAIYIDRNQRHSEGARS